MWLLSYLIYCDGCHRERSAGRGNKTTPQWVIKPHPSPFLAILDPWMGFCRTWGWFYHPFLGGWFYHPILDGGLSPLGLVF